MFLYNSATKNKSMKTNKVPPQLIQHFKNTAEITKISFKENHNPKQIKVHPDIKIENKNDGGHKKDGLQKSTKMAKSKVVQEDISRIANSYILEGNILKKHEAYQVALKKDKEINKPAPVNKQNVQQPKTYNRKQMLKLEYLQKMGVLRPDQMQTLAQFRKMSQQTTKQTPHQQQLLQKNINPFIRPHSKTFQNTQMYNLPFSSPKGMKFAQSPFIGSNSKFMFQSHMTNY